MSRCGPTGRGGRWCGGARASRLAAARRATGPGCSRRRWTTWPTAAPRRSKKALPAYKHYYLANYKKDKKTGKYNASPNVDDFIATAKRIGADGLDLQAADPLDQAACKKIIDAGLELHIWTVDDPAVAKRYVDWGAMSITTNRSHWLHEQLAAMDKK